MLPQQLLGVGMPSRQERRIKATQELSHKGHVVFRELRERPGSDRMLLLARVLTRRRLLTRNQPGISIVHDDRTVQFSQPCQCLGWLRSSLKRITQAHHVLNPLLAYIFEDLVKGKTVTVDV